MNIGLIDADLIDGGTRHPNLAIMKMAGYYIQQGHNVKLILDGYDSIANYDRVFISKVFSFTKTGNYTKEDFEAMDNVVIGGTGFFMEGGPQLEEEIEHHMPYYDIYKEFLDLHIKSAKDRTKYSDYLDYSIGFTTRGCFRKCEFCVNKKYDHVKRHAPVHEFLDNSRPMIYLWDDNILGYPNWEEVIDELVATGKPFHFKQGIDIRLMTEKRAKRFNEVKYHSDFTFAFDHLKDAETIIRNVQLWKMYSARIPRMYVLSGFDSQDEKDVESVLERIHILMKYGSLPYIMRYEKYKESKYASLYIQLARWCNQPQFYKKKSFREYCELNDLYKTTPGHSSAMKALNLFENDYPEIAKKYFDLKFEEENYYFNTGFGEEQRYQNKRPCDYCKALKLDWKTVIEKSDEDFLVEFITKKINFKCLEYKNSECSFEKQYVTKVMNALDSVSEKELFDALSFQVDKDFGEVAANTKNFKVNFEEVEKLLSLVGDEEKRADTIGKEFFNKKELTSSNITKMTSIALSAARLGLVYSNRRSNKRYLSISPLGNEFKKKTIEIRMAWYNKLQFSNPYLLYFIKNDMKIADSSNEFMNMESLNQELYKMYLDLNKG